VPRERGGSLATPTAPHERDIGASHPLAYKPGGAARKLGLSRATIYNMLSDGRLSSIKIGATTLIRHEELERLLDEAPLSPHTKFAQASMR
jgi:excisionase family DNA binding protein